MTRRKAGSPKIVPIRGCFDHVPDVSPQMAMELNAGVTIPTVEEMERERQWRDDASLILEGIIRWWNWRAGMIASKRPFEVGPPVPAMIALPHRGDSFQLRPAGPSSGGPLRNEWETLECDPQGRPILTEKHRAALRGGEVDNG